MRHYRIIRKSDGWDYQSWAGTSPADALAALCRMISRDVPADSVTITLEP